MSSWAVKEFRIKNAELRMRVQTAENIQERTFNFACRIIRLYQYLIKQDKTNKDLFRQLVRSGTSIGANLEEANAAQSRADFISKCMIALKEARETNYWLRIFKTTNVVSEGKLKSLLQESNEIISILTVIVKKSKLRKEHN
jgi:four helix bundle protein